MSATKHPPPDANSSSHQVEIHKKRGKKRSKAKERLFILGMMAMSGICLLAVGVGLYWQFSKDLPTLISIADYRPLGVTQIIARDDDAKEKIVAEFFKERRYVIPYERIPESVIKAFISAEDDEFFRHQGISPVAILRAAIANFKAGHVVQGGSTITQQVAKSLFLTPERIYVRKIKEAILAARIERNLTKQQILFLYLNQIYLGHGAYGVQAAAKLYFRKDVSEMTLPEVALLAGMPQAPGKYSPFLNPKKTKNRQLYVLRRMHENKYISREQMTEAAAQPLKIYRDRNLYKIQSDYLVEHVRRYLIRKYGEKGLYEDSLKVRLPAPLRFYKFAQQALRDGLEAVDKRRGYRGPLRRLTNAQQRVEFAQKTIDDLRKKKLKFEIFLPEGKMDREQALVESGFDQEKNLLDLGTDYEALVTEVNDKKNYASVQIGTTDFKLPMAQMEWAHRFAKKKRFRPKLPQKPSEVLRKHDVILVRLIEVEDEEDEKKKEKKKDQKIKKEVVASLFQIPKVQGAIVSIDVRTGIILALVGGYDFKTSEFNRAVQAKRQMGSAFKPIIYSCALENGYNPASIIEDSPIVYDDGEKGKWKPTNFSERFFGDTTFRQALILSRNIPTIRLVQDLQVEAVIAYANQLGMAGPFNHDLSISLGSGITTLLELTKVYSLFPRLGRKVEPIFIHTILDRDGHELERNDPQPHLKLEMLLARGPLTKEEERERDAFEEDNDLDGMESEYGETFQSGEDLAAMGGDQGASSKPKVSFLSYPLEQDSQQIQDPRVAFIMSHLLREVVNYGTGRKAKVLGREVAGKTGTTNEYKDAWFMGFTQNIVTGVWVGFDDQEGMGRGETGSKAALPIWLQYMKKAVKFFPELPFAVPEGVRFVHIASKTGKKILNKKSPLARREVFIKGTEPAEIADPNQESVETESEFFKEEFE